MIKTSGFPGGAHTANARNIALFAAAGGRENPLIKKRANCGTPPNLAGRK